MSLHLEKGSQLVSKESPVEQKAHGYPIKKKLIRTSHRKHTLSNQLHNHEKASLEY